MLVAVRIAAQPQLKRVELERNGEFVHRAFERIDAGRGARALACRRASARSRRAKLCTYLAFGLL